MRRSWRVITGMWLAACLVLAACAREQATPDDEAASALPGRILVVTEDGQRVRLENANALRRWLEQAGDRPVAITLAPGQYPLNRPLRLPSRSSLTGSGQGVSVLVARQAMEALVTNRDHEAGNAHISLGGFSVDCARQADHGVLSIRTADLHMERIGARRCRQTGIRVSGHGEITRGAVLEALTARDNAGHGIVIMWAARNTRYSNLYASGNGQTGIVIDHSEGSAVNLHADGNRLDGIFIRNVFAVTATNLVATRNGRHGIYVQGMVASAGSAWTAQGNSRSEPGAHDELHFTADGQLSYGMTRNSVIHGVVLGAYINGVGEPTARHGLYIAPEIAALQVEGLAFEPVLATPLGP
ncbi:MAG: right-handed parallel beta-helix repeat-containing protein [Glycocaulis sp.]